MKISHLLETLNAPKNGRRHFLQYLGSEMAETVTCYHVTEAERSGSIRANGLKATECQQGRVTRQAACYLFIDERDITEAIKILGIENPVVIEAKLTGDQLLDKANYDGMFNTSFEDYVWSAIQYLDDIAPEVIK